MKLIALYILFQLLFCNGISDSNGVYPSSCSEITSYENQKRSSICSPNYILMTATLEYVADEPVLGKFQFPRENETINGCTGNEFSDNPWC